MKSIYLEVPCFPQESPSAFMQMSLQHSHGISPAKLHRKIGKFSTVAQPRPSRTSPAVLWRPQKHPQVWWTDEVALTLRPPSAWQQPPASGSDHACFPRATLPCPGLEPTLPSPYHLLQPSPENVTEKAPWGWERNSGHITQKLKSISLTSLLSIWAGGRGQSQSTK